MLTAYHTDSPATPIMPVSHDACATRKGNTARCSNCALRRLCMPSDLTSGDLGRLDAIITTSRTIKKGEALYRAGNEFQSIYAVRAGSFKTVVMHRSGREQVTGFHIAGEPLGLDGIYGGTHGCDAIALEDSSVCIIPFQLLEILCRELKVMQHHVHKLMSGEIVRESGLMMMLGNMSAEERVAAFLLNMSSRLAARGYSSSEFNLRMTRDEIGSYLGMKLETVSRMFSKFHRDHLIDTHGKQVRILDMEGLRNV